MSDNEKNIIIYNTAADGKKYNCDNIRKELS